MADTWSIGKYAFTSRLLVGTGKYADFPTMQRALAASGAAVVTVAVRRLDLSKTGAGSLLEWIPKGMKLLPNTSACFTAEEAIPTARLGRELEMGGLVKLEVIGDRRTLFPDVEGLLQAARVLVKEGFTVLPYTNDDPVTAKKLEDAGGAAASDAAVAMELGAVAVLMNTAIAEAKDPVLMAEAMRAGVEAGRKAFLAGRIPMKLHASASSPMTGLIGS